MSQLKTSLLLAVLATTAALTTARISAQTTAPAEVAAPATPPTTQPLVLADPVSPEARVLLDKLSAAVAASKGFTANGTFAADVDVAGQKESQSKAFTSSFATPFLFKHEVKDEFFLGSTGEKVYAYKPDEKQYLQTDAPKARAAARDLPALVPQVLRTQNPLLLLALTVDSTAELTRGASSVVRGPDTTIGDAACPTITIESPDGALISLALDAKTDLLRRVSIDFAKVLVARQAPDVKKATLVTDYATITTDVPAADTFAWAPPEGSKDIAKAAAEEQKDAAAAGDAAVLLGKPAPEFTLKDESGKDIKLADLAGSVVVIDFWATWCGPCREGLPHLDKLVAARQGKALKVYAINLRETPDLVAKFKEKTGLKLPVLFDTDGKLAETYKVSGIPQTVVIGKDGIVRKVVIGFDPAEAAKLDAEVDAALEGSSTPAPTAPPTTAPAAN